LIFIVDSTHSIIPSATDSEIIETVPSFLQLIKSHSKIFFIS